MPVSMNFECEISQLSNLKSVVKNGYFREHRSIVGFEYDDWEGRRSGEPVNMILAT